MGSEKPLRSEKFLGVLYPDSTSYDCESVKQSIRDNFDKFAFCVHDKDVDPDTGELIKPHIHWVAKRSQTTIQHISSLIGLPEHDINICKKFNKAVRYLIHADDPEKYQYCPDDVEINFEFVFNDSVALLRLNMLVDYLYEYRITSVGLLYKYAFRNGCISELTRNFSILSAMMAEIKEEDNKL